MLQAAVRNASPALRHAAEHIEHVVHNAHASGSLARAPSRPTLRRACASAARNNMLDQAYEIDFSNCPRTPSCEANFSTMIDVHGNPMSPGTMPNTPRLSSHPTLSNGFFSASANNAMEAQSPLNENPHNAVSLSARP